MDKKYRVGVREVHVRFYEVKAGSPEQAKTLVKQRGPDVIDIGHQEYSHELPVDTWSVEERGEEEKS